METVTKPESAQVEVWDRDAYVRKHRRKQQVQYLLDQVGVRIFLVAMSLLFLIPLYWMLITAIKPTDELTAFPPEFWPHTVLWSNFLKAYNFIPFATYFFNSFMIALFSVLGTVLSNMLVGYGFSCIEWPGREKVFYLVLATLFFPVPVALIPLFDMFARLQWVNTALPLIVPSFFASAVNIFLFRQFMRQIPLELLDAARIDGASELQILWRIALPMCTPIIAVVSIFTAVAKWNDFTGPLIYIQNDAFRPLSVGLQFFQSTHDVQFNLLMAAAFLTVLPLIIIFFAFQRFFIRGVTVGSIR